MVRTYACQGGTGISMSESKTKTMAASVAVEPVDLAHLDRQTLGDRQLRSEVLTLFLNETALAGTTIEAADVHQRRQSAHRLVGSARAIGAFPLAEAAVGVERSPLSAPALARLSSRIDEVRTFILALS